MHQAETSPFALWHDQLACNGYSPLPILPTTKRPSIAGWQRACVEPLDEDCRRRLARGGHGLGIALGFDQVVALDLDTEDSDILSTLKPILEPSLVAKRGNRGSTHFFRGPMLKSRKFRSQAGPMILEVLAEGNQTVLPPTIHPENGRPYVWLTSRTLFNTPAKKLPCLPDHFIKTLEQALQDWLPTRTLPVEIFCKPVRSLDRYLGAVVEGIVRDVAATKPGGRNDLLNRSAFRLGLLGVDRDQTFHHLLRAALSCGLSEAEATRTINSGWRAGHTG